jgi:hypothetical protein
MPHHPLIQFMCPTDFNQAHIIIYYYLFLFRSARSIGLRQCLGIRGSFFSLQLYRYFVSQSGEFCRNNTLCCFSTSVYCCLFRYRLSPETFGYTLVSYLLMYSEFFHSLVHWTEWKEFRVYVRMTDSNSERNPSKWLERNYFLLLFFCSVVFATLQYYCLFIQNVGIPYFSWILN